VNATSYARPAYVRNNKVPAALLLWALLIGLAAIRRGSLPDQSVIVPLLVASIVIVVAANFVPDPIFYLLLLAVIALALQDSAAIVAWVNTGTAKIQGAFSA
jgi:hypothetical protein